MTEDEPRYTPVPCAVYGAYELAIMHRQRLRAVWRDAEGRERLGILQPLDLQTRAGAEFLIARAAAGELVRLRLDRILGTTPV